MSVRLLFFSLLQDVVGTESMEFPIESDPVTTATLLDKLFEQLPELKKWDKKLLVAVNCEYADPETLIHSGDEVAIMPPVQGG